MRSKTLGIEDPEVAADVDRALHSAFNTLGDSLRRVMQSCKEEDAATYKQKISDISYIITFELMEPLYEEHPQLKPPDWDRENAQ